MVRCRPVPWQNEIETRLKNWEAEGLRRQLRCDPGVSFSHNDYLGLSRREEIIEAGVRALRENGSGARGSRLLGGHSRAIQEAEERIAAFFRAPAALFFPSGYQANLGAGRVLAELADVVYSDEKNHASLIDAISLSKVKKIIVPHLGWKSLEKPTGRVLAVSDSFFSMDGDNVEGSGLGEFLERSEGFLLLDEAHAAGVYREDGRGFFHGDYERAAVVVTFGKAIGVAGAVVLGSKALREWLVNRARSFVYSTAPSPAVPAMVSASLDLIEKEPALRQELWDRARSVRARLRGTGRLPAERNDWEKISPIIPFRIEGEEKALRFCENMRNSGFDLKAIRYPTVPRGQERIRISLNLLASRAACDSLAAEMVKQWTAFA